MKVIGRAAGSNTLGVGKATVTTRVATPIPMRFATTTNTVRMIWMRMRRLRWLSDTRPRTHEPYSGVAGTRLLWLVTRSSTRPSRCATDLLAVIVAKA